MRDGGVGLARRQRVSPQVIDDKENAGQEKKHCDEKIEQGTKQVKTC